jgi:hypothetical protein
MSFLIVLMAKVGRWNINRPRIKARFRNLLNGKTLRLGRPVLSIAANCRV